MQTELQMFHWHQQGISEFFWCYLILLAFLLVSFTLVVVGYSFDPKLGLYIFYTFSKIGCIQNASE